MAASGRGFHNSALFQQLEFGIQEDEHDDLHTSIAVASGSLSPGHVMLTSGFGSLTSTSRSARHTDAEQLYLHGTHLSSDNSSSNFRHPEGLAAMESLSKCESSLHRSQTTVPHLGSADSDLQQSQPPHRSQSAVKQTFMSGVARKGSRRRVVLGRKGVASQAPSTIVPHAKLQRRAESAPCIPAPITSPFETNCRPMHTKRPPCPPSPPSPSRRTNAAPKTHPADSHSSASNLLLTVPSVRTSALQGRSQTVASPATQMSRALWHMTLHNSIASPRWSQRASPAAVDTRGATSRGTAGSELDSDTFIDRGTVYVDASGVHLPDTCRVDCSARDITVPLPSPIGGGTGDGRTSNCSDGSYQDASRTSTASDGSSDAVATRATHARPATVFTFRAGMLTHARKMRVMIPIASTVAEDRTQYVPEPQPAAAHSVDGHNGDAASGSELACDETLGTATTDVRRTPPRMQDQPPPLPAQLRLVPASEQSSEEGMDLPTPRSPSARRTPSEPCSPEALGSRVVDISCIGRSRAEVEAAHAMQLPRHFAPASPEHMHWPLDQFIQVPPQPSSCDLSDRDNSSMRSSLPSGDTSLHAASAGGAAQAVPGSLLSIRERLAHSGPPGAAKARIGGVVVQLADSVKASGPQLEWQRRLQARTAQSDKTNFSLCISPVCLDQASPTTDGDHAAAAHAGLAGAPESPAAVDSSLLELPLSPPPTDDAEPMGHVVPADDSSFLVDVSDEDFARMLASSPAFETDSSPL